MSVEVTSKINGVSMEFDFNVTVGITTSSTPTGFTTNYIETLVETASEHFMNQMADAIIEKIEEDLKPLPGEKVWKTDT